MKAHQKASNLGKQLLSESKFFMGYSRWRDDRQAYETWSQSVDRVMAMHKDKYAQHLNSELDGLMEKAREAYNDKLILGAQRALQFGGEQLRKHEAKIYNCSFSYCDRPAFFSEAMYLLLCGCGVGFSVQHHHVNRLPEITPRTGTAKTFTVPDSIEGWADAFGVLLASYFVGGGEFPEYAGHRVKFDLSQIRPAGAMISGGFKAPGPDGLRQSLELCEQLLNRQLANGENRLAPIVAYDFTMHMADAVLSGGVRRSATICLFDKDDQEMLNAKTGDWYIDNPQRGRSNNSVIIKRDELTRDEWAGIMQSVRDYGEPGFVFTESLEFGFNPCVEIGLYPVTEDGVSGFQFCNLSEINGGACVDRETFLKACEAAAIMGTLQAGYTHFKYLKEASRKITEREALIGVSITGWMNNPDVLFDDALLKEGAELVKQTNKRIAKLININPAARSTCVKPSGNASVLLGTASGIHGEHAPRYIRHVQINELDEVAKLMQENNPDMCETSVWSKTDKVLAFPMTPKDGSHYKHDLLGVKQLEFVKKAQQAWVVNGTDAALCRDDRLRHNVSNTITVDDWDEVEQYIFDNREWFAGISLLAASGDRSYPQAPFTQVYTEEEIVENYGAAALFSSGLVEGALFAFDENLWLACDTALGRGLTLSTTKAADLLKCNWVRRFKQFAEKYFAGDLLKASFCLKDCYNLHKWETIQKNIQAIDFTGVLGEPRYVDVDTLASQACAGGACEITF